MSNFNEYNIRQVGERIRLPGISVSISEKKKEDGTLVRWAQLSKSGPSPRINGASIISCPNPTSLISHRFWTSMTLPKNSIL